MEQEGDSSHIQLILQQAKACRERAVEEIKEKFGIELTCECVFDRLKEENKKEQEAMQSKAEDGAEDNAAK